MRSNRKILFGVLILVALVVLFGMYRLISNGVSQIAANTPPPGTTPGNVRSVSASTGGKIAVAAYDIPARSIVTPDMLKLVDHAGNNQGFITDPELQADGFITRVALPAGAQIRPADDFVGHISKVGIVAAIQPGMRAMVIPIANKPTFHDLVGIGNYVDVLASFDSQEARPIVQGVRVLAVDIYGSDYPKEESVAKHGPYKAAPQPRDATGAPVAPAGNVPPADPNATATPAPTAPPANIPRPDAAITLEVTQEQAATIQLAQQSGAQLDFLLLPGGPEALTGDGTVVTPGATPGPQADVVTVSVTKRDIAPKAEAYKRAGAPRQVSAPRSGGDGGSYRSTSAPLRNFNPPILPTPSNQVEPWNDKFPNPNATFAPPAPQTYTIPVYADSQPVRNDTVLKP